MPKLTAVPALKSSAGKLKVKQRVLMGLIAAGFLCGPLALWRSSSTPAPIVQANVPIEASSTKAQEAARLIAEDYLAGRPTTFPTAEGVPADFERGESGALAHGPLVLSGVTYTHDETESEEIFAQSWDVAFSFRADSGTSYKIHVLLHATKPEQVLVLAASPSISQLATPVPGVTIPEMGQAGVKLQAVPAIVPDAVTRWANAFVGGSADALKQEANVGGDPANQYQPLTGFTLQGSPAVRDVSDRGDGKWIVRVRLGLAKDSFSTSADYDVLVLNDGVGHVVAWGTPGSGGSLEQQGNRL